MVSLSSKGQLLIREKEQDILLQLKQGTMHFGNAEGGIEQWISRNSNTSFVRRSWMVHPIEKSGEFHYGSNSSR